MIGITSYRKPGGSSIAGEKKLAIVKHSRRAVILSEVLVRDSGRERSRRIPTHSMDIRPFREFLTHSRNSSGQHRADEKEKGVPERTPAKYETDRSYTLAAFAIFAPDAANSANDGTDSGSVVFFSGNAPPVLKYSTSISIAKSVFGRI